MQLKRPGILLASWLVILSACAQADQPTTTVTNPADATTTTGASTTIATTTTSVGTTTSPSVDLSTADPCMYISNGAVKALFPEVESGEAHISVWETFRACVFFQVSFPVVSVDLRRLPTAAADVEALLMELFPSDVDFTHLTVQGLPAYYSSCAHVVDEPCAPTIAFGSEPYFFVIHFRLTFTSTSRPTTSGEAQETATALASAVLANLGK